MVDTGHGKTFLVVEDSADDAALIRRAFETVESCQAFICRNISEARAYIQGAGMYQDRTRYPFPNGVICDFRLGDEVGTQFLTWIKTKSEFPDLPFFILTGEASAKEMIYATNLGATEVLRKPSCIDELRLMLTDLAAKLCT